MGNFKIYGNEIGGKKIFLSFEDLVVLPTTWFIMLSVILMLVVLWSTTFDEIGRGDYGIGIDCQLQ